MTFHSYVTLPEGTNNNLDVLEMSELGDLLPSSHGTMNLVQIYHFFFGARGGMFIMGNQFPCKATSEWHMNSLMSSLFDLGT